ncbi:MAG: MBL fold metallo-hydrolase [Vicinamibacteraceae bacterium]
MTFHWLAHASFLIEGHGMRILTDPYTPELMGFRPITAQVDLVIRSSRDDAGHCCAERLPGAPHVVTATDLVAGPLHVKGIRITAVAVRESVAHKREPLDSAMYRFHLEGLDVVHMGDVGNALSASQLDALRGADVLLAPAGGAPTIDLDDLYAVIEEVAPGWVIPMHYHLPGCAFSMLPVEAFLKYFDPAQIQILATSTIELDAGQRADRPGLIVLQAANLS